MEGKRLPPVSLAVNTSVGEAQPLGCIFRELSPHWCFLIPPTAGTYFPLRLEKNSGKSPDLEGCLVNN